jgi:hypothetical protein
MFTVIWGLISNFPELLGVIISLQQAWSTWKDENDRAAKIAALQTAITNAKASRDTTQLTSLINSIVTGQPLPPG